MSNVMRDLDLRGEREHGAWDTLKAKWKAAEQERDHLKTQKDILWQGLNEAKEHIARVEQERDAHAAEIVKEARDGRP